MKPAVHEDIARLIPWYVNGTLADDEQRLVQKHLDSCLPCRAELTFQRQLARSVRESDVDSDAVSAHFASLLKQIDAASVPSEGMTGPTLARGASGKRVLTNSNWLALAAALALVASGLGLFWPGTERAVGELPGDYRTLSAPVTAAGEIVLAFQQDASETMIAEMLTEYGFEAVSRAEDQRLWRVRRIATGRGDAELSAILARLREDPRVLFAGQALPGE